MLRRGKVLIVNTRSGRLGEMGAYLGQVLIALLQYAAFRRPTDIPGDTLPEERRRHFMLHIDEFPEFANPEMRRFFTMARSLRVAMHVYFQSPQQIAKLSAQLYADTMGNTRQKVIFAPEAAEDAKLLSETLGEEEKTTKMYTRSAQYGWPFRFFPRGENRSERYITEQRPIFSSTDLQRLRFGDVVYKITVDNTPRRPRRGLVDFLPRDLQRRALQAADAYLAREDGDLVFGLGGGAASSAPEPPSFPGPAAPPEGAAGPYEDL